MSSVFTRNIISQSVIKINIKPAMWRVNFWRRRRDFPRPVHNVRRVCGAFVSTQSALRLVSLTHCEPIADAIRFHSHFSIRIKNTPIGVFLILAETKGFEPLIPLRVCLISSQVHSTTLPRLRRRPLYSLEFFLQGFIFDIALY